MADKTRVTSHFGRIGSTVHNARDFDLNNAPHIDKDRAGSNLYLCVEQMEDGSWGYNWCPTQGEFVESELAYYTDRFGQSLGRKNDRHIAARHYKRVKTMEEVYHGQHTQPTEQILQIGDKDTCIDPTIMRRAWTDYLRWVRDWSADHGGHLHLLSSALHVDETSPHAHNRYVWEYVDDAGVVHIDQDKAMEQAGLELPDATQPRSRYNNRAMTWTAMCRDKWIDICQGYGIDVELEPVKGRTHKTKEDYIAEQERKKDLDQRERAVEALERASEAALEQARVDAARMRQEAQRAAEAAQRAEKEADGLRMAVRATLASNKAELERLGAVPTPVTSAERQMLEVAKRTPLKGGTTIYSYLQQQVRVASISGPSSGQQQATRQYGRDF